uniref:RNA polymerase sigma factor n=1 Tax=Pedobacter schmidteae TaxID=2201271 RepID=UPI000EAFA46F|nr:RNA polymerase sigma-70 factor [Pedobacter schmidteae]
MAIKPLPLENELLVKIAEGNEPAFCKLFDHYRKYVFSFGRKLTRSEEAAEEVVQDVFLKVWLGRERLKEVGNFGAYLNVLVRNHSFNLLRQMGQQQKADQKLLLSAPQEDHSTEQVLDYREAVRVLDEALQLLPAQQKMVYTLCHQDGLKYEEAAEKMDISAATVHYHMKLALNHIREHFKKNAVAYPVVLLFLIK